MEIGFQQLLILEYLNNNYNHYSIQEIQEKLGITHERLIDLIKSMIKSELLYFNQENLLSLTPSGQTLIKGKSIKRKSNKLKNKISKSRVEEEYLLKIF